MSTSHLLSPPAVWARIGETGVLGQAAGYCFDESDRKHTVSSTNRGGQTRRRRDDYPTPGWCTTALLHAFDEQEEMGWTNHVRTATAILDPFAGAGALLEAVRAAGSEVPLAAWDIDHSNSAPLRALAGPRTWIGDTFTRTDIDVGTVVLTNPPYSSAEPAVRLFVEGQESACAAFLLRLAFLESKKRSAWLMAHPPARVMVLSKRPSFTNGGTDSAAYAWFVWEREWRENWSRTVILPAP